MIALVRRRREACQGRPPPSLARRPVSSARTPSSLFVSSTSSTVPRPTIFGPSRQSNVASCLSRARMPWLAGVPHCSPARGRSKSSGVGWMSGSRSGTTTRSMGALRGSRPQRGAAGVVGERRRSALGFGPAHDVVECLCRDRPRTERELLPSVRGVSVPRRASGVCLQQTPGFQRMTHHADEGQGLPAACTT
jgi:hypothetical protein